MTAAGVGLGGEAFRFRCKEVVESRRNDEVGNAASAISTGFALSRFVRTTAKQGRAIGQRLLYNIRRFPTSSQTTVPAARKKPQPLMTSFKPKNKSPQG